MIAADEIAQAFGEALGATESEYPRHVGLEAEARAIAAAVLAAGSMIASAVLKVRYPGCDTREPAMAPAEVGDACRRCGGASGAVLVGDDGLCSLCGAAIGMVATTVEVWAKGEIARGGASAPAITVAPPEPTPGGTLTIAPLRRGVQTDRPRAEIEVSPGESQESIASRAAAALNDLRDARQAAASRAVPLLEYFDQLEVVAKRMGVVGADGVLALVAKLRGAIAIVQRATEIASMQASGWRGSMLTPSAVLNRFQDEVVAWAQIAVPA